MLSYCWAASCCRAPSDTRPDMSWVRSMPTAPGAVVCTDAHPAATPSDATRNMPARRRRPKALTSAFMMAPAKNARASATGLGAMPKGVIHENDGQQRLDDGRGANADAWVVASQRLHRH